MSFGKFTVSFVAIILAMVLVCHETSAAESVSHSVVNATSNGTSEIKPAVSGVVPPVPATAAHLRVRRKGLGGIGGAVAGGVASGAALSLLPGILG